jgi:hypothetical protein
MDCTMAASTSNTKVSDMRTLSSALGYVVAAAVLPSVASAQIGWVEYTEDNSRISAPNNLVVNDAQEKDYAWGDLDKDGWTDLVIVRKQPFTTTGRKSNVLLMNEGGVLTDRTNDYATSSDVINDNGFKTNTNDRDVIFVDVDVDGWLDVVTATTLTAGQPKHISHPRVYMNLGEDGSGNWLGLHFEHARTPQIKLIGSGTDYFPFFCGVGAGDLTGDDVPDLYFADYDVAGFSDVNDRLFVNDGSGFFSDQSTSRMSTAMLKSPFGTSAVIYDMNGDGVNDVVKNTGLGQTSGNPLVAISYNNPSNEGFFNILHQPYNGDPYHVNIGDLNQDGNMDMVISDDGSDRYMLHEGVDALGRVTWSNAHTFNTDDGFGSNTLVADLNDDGWGDALITDVDVDITGCARRMHIYHNKGGTVGGFVNLDEESGSGFRGVKGMTNSDLVGTHDVAVFDLDNDGDNDMLVGRCSGTSLWVNTLYEPGDDGIGTNYCDPAVNNSTGQPGITSATGSDLTFLNDVTLHATQLPTNQFGYFLTSQTSGFIANPGGSQGNLCLGGTMGRYASDVANSGSAGELTLKIDLTSMPPPVQSAVQAGESWHFTCWHRDVGQNSNFTNGLQIDFL